MTSQHSILILDDHEGLASMLSSALTKEGYDVHTVGSTREAIEYLKQHVAPTFILADRILDEPIEVRDLEKLCKVAPASKVLVYTAVEELTSEQQYRILKKGAYRVLDKSAVNQLVKDIKVLTQDLEELLELATELKKATLERSKIMAALVGSDVGVSVIDRHLHHWYHNSAAERSGGACRDLCWTAIFEPSAGPSTCWGCTVSDVFRSQVPVDGLFLNRFPDGSVKWVAVRSTPVFGPKSNSIIAAREAVTDVSTAALAGIPLDQRLHYIAQSLIRVGFGRARIYKASSPNEIRLMAAAARSDSPQSSRSDYFETIRDLPIEVDRCPYTLLALKNRTGCFIPEWDPELGVSPLAKPLGLEPAYFEVPLWRDGEKLDGWITVDFVGMDSALRSRAITQLARKESLNWLQDEYGREVKRTFEAAGGKPAHRDKFEIAQRARLGIAEAKSVDDATREIREAFGKLLPLCRVSVRMSTGGNLREFESLCWGPRSAISPGVISLQNDQSLAASTVRSQLPIWITDYDGYAVVARERGDPVGYTPKGTRSVAQIPLRFENTVFGSLSIDSYETIQWDDDGYKEPILALAKDTALVLRDLALHEELDQVMADRAAIVAYSVSASADALWRHWAQQRLAQASALVARTRRLLTTDSMPKWEDVDRLLTQISTVITRVNTARPVEEAPRSCSVAEVFVRLKELYSDRQPRPSFHAPKSLPNLGIPAFIFRNTLMVLVDNALRAIQDSGQGTAVTVEVRSENGFFYIDVSDDGPGVPVEERDHILRGPMKSQDGRGLGLLYARGAALQFDGDLTLTPTVTGARFTLKLPHE